MRFSLASWNVNSVRLRIDLVARFVRRFRPDILCLQEIRCREEDFPASALRALGFGHLLIHGQKGTHGVAIASRIALTGVSRAALARRWPGRAEAARHVAAQIPTPQGPIDLHNFYVPSGGGAPPDPGRNPKFAHKLAFLDTMAGFFAPARRHAPAMILAGDLNVAPGENDVWSHQKLRRSIGHTATEIQRLNRVQATRNWIDIARRTTPPDRKLYSWWSYRARDWQAPNCGWRLDHIWLTPALAERCPSFEIVRAARAWPRPSDHAPLIARFRI